MSAERQNVGGSVVNHLATCLARSEANYDKLRFALSDTSFSDTCKESVAAGALSEFPSAYSKSGILSVAGVARATDTTHCVSPSDRREGGGERGSRDRNDAGASAGEDKFRNDGNLNVDVAHIIARFL